MPAVCLTFETLTHPSLTSAFSGTWSLDFLYPRSQIPCQPKPNSAGQPERNTDSVMGRGGCLRFLELGETGKSLWTHYPFLAMKRNATVEVWRQEIAP